MLAWKQFYVNVKYKYKHEVETNDRIDNNIVMIKNVIRYE